MGMVASIDNPYSKQVKEIPSLIDNKGTLQENVATMDGKRMIFLDKRGNQRNRQRVLDEYPTHIKLVKNPPPDLYPTDYYATQDRRRMFLHDDTVRNRLGDSILYREPGFPEPRRMILYDKQRVQGPKKLVLYDPSRYDHSKRIMDYYDRSLSNKYNLNFQNQSSNNSRADQNLIYLNATPTRLDKILYYNNNSYGQDDRRTYGGITEGNSKVFNQFASDNLKSRQQSNDSSYRETNLIKVSPIPSRRSSDSALLTTRELEVETVEKYQDSDGKIYKIVKPIGERSRIIYNKPENYERFLIVENSPQGSLIVLRTQDTLPPSVEPSPVPDEDLKVDEDPKVDEEPTEEQAEGLEIPEEEPKIDEEVFEPPQPEVPIKEEIKVVEEKKAILATSSTQTNPKINYKKNPKSIRMMSRQPSVTELSTN